MDMPFIFDHCPYCGNKMKLIGEQTFFVPDDEERKDADFDGTIFVCAVNPQHTVIVGLTDFGKQEESHDKDNKI